MHWALRRDAGMTEAFGDADCISSKVLCLRRRRHEAFFPPGDCTSTAPRCSNTVRCLEDSSASVSTVALIGTELRWNDGMNRVGEQGVARASGSAGFCTPR